MDESPYSDSERHYIDANKPLIVSAYEGSITNFIKCKSGGQRGMDAHRPSHGLYQTQTGDRDQIITNFELVISLDFDTDVLARLGARNLANLNKSQILDIHQSVKKMSAEGKKPLEISQTISEKYYDF